MAAAAQLLAGGGGVAGGVMVVAWVVVRAWGLQAGAASGQHLRQLGNQAAAGTTVAAAGAGVEFSLRLIGLSFNTARAVASGPRAHLAGKPLYVSL